MRLRFTALPFAAMLGCQEVPYVHERGDDAVVYSVGEICRLSSTTPAGPNGVIINSPSIDCVSRMCIAMPSPALTTVPGGDLKPGFGMCTTECEYDEDCEAATDTPCESGFACEAVTTVGAFGCQKLCVCKDHEIEQGYEDAPCVVGS